MTARVGSACCLGFCSLLLVRPVRWAFGNPEREVPIPALGANVISNLATNTIFALSLFSARALG